ncbi:hypothetical protein [Antiquaquibacter soli]|uniref:Uncharacterized protein n=1 Tax=Antiquaquibacter soli TaxID=3064523 RepID=A0ABT9BN03_9MICO|nr:hypothetical protein [Protaetiibacter sp. WY-16]MDO7882380.1 hypothetical protein [Protaetiibacter sp. WY-16]
MAQLEGPNRQFLAYAAIAPLRLWPIVLVVTPFALAVAVYFGVAIGFEVHRGNLVRECSVTFPPGSPELTACEKSARSWP